MPAFRSVLSPLVVAAGAIAVFWITAGVSDFFLDRPFVYTLASEWSENLVRSKARFPSGDELALHWVAVVLLVPAMLGLSLVGAQLGKALFERGVTALRSKSRSVVLGLALLATLAAAGVAFLVLRQTLLIDDERAYAFEAALFGQGRVKLPDMPAAFRNPMLLTTPWMGKYPPGQSLLLLPGALLGVPHLVLPLCAGALVLVSFGFVREVYGERQALAGAALTAFSPFVWCASGTLMAFTSTALTVLATFWCLAHAERTGSRASYAGVGACLGVMFLLRPFDAVTIGLPLAVWLLASARTRQAWVGFLALGVGLLPFLGLFLGFNWLTLGSPWKMPYIAANDLSVGFYVQSLPGVPYVHTPAQGIAVITAGLIRLDLWLLGWPLALLFVLVGGFTARTPWDRFLVAVVVVFLLTHTLIPATGTWDVGPTYYLPIAPVLIVLVVRGLAFLLAEFPIDSMPGRLLAALPVAGTLVALLTVLPIRALRLSALASEIEAPWVCIKEAKVGDSIVVLPGQKAMEAAGYALGYPYRLESGAGIAHLIRPFNAEELAEARKVLGEHLPVYTLIFDPEAFRVSGIRRYSLRRLGAEAANLTERAGDFAGITPERN